MRRAATGSAAALAALLLVSVPGDARGQDPERGRALYDRWCAECHGHEGRGDGPAADHMLPRPRDFTAARYQVRTTGSGELPTDEDILRVLRNGLPGTTMPGWPNLGTRQLQDMVAYLKSLSPFFEGPSPGPMEFGRDPGGGEQALASGRAAYEALECHRCHGEAGRGDGTSAPTLEDWRDFPVRAADLTKPWLFDGGAAASEIHARILTGLDGTPMPSAVEALEAGIVTEDELWHLAHFVRSLGPRRVPPRLREVVRVPRAEGPLPEEPDDEAWEEAEAFYFPLVGQVVVRPRQFAPAVTGVWVQGLHDGRELALRLTWNDPSRSPDPAWAEWQEQMARTMFDDGVPRPAEPLPDAFAVQFPFEIPAGMERPYFLMGDRRAPVYLWRWDSREGVSEARARGLGEGEALPGAGLRGSAVHQQGQWRLVFRRALEAGEAEGLSFLEGVAIPVAFFAWDGSSGEDATRGSIGSWYYLVLEEPESRAVFLIPLLVVALTGGLGALAVRRAQRRWRT